jgi:hypothetical protein
MSGLFIVGPNDLVIQQYRVSAEEQMGRGVGLHPPVHDGAFVLNEEGFVAGVLLYPTEGPYVLVEHLVINPAVRLREAHGAVSMLAFVAHVYCTCRGKIGIVRLPRQRRLPGVARVLGRAGWLVSPDGTEFCTNEVMTTGLYAPTLSVTPTRTRKGGSRAPTAHRPSKASPKLRSR